MLVLTRKSNQTIRITVPPSSEATTIDVTAVSSNNVKSRIGIEAPAKVEVDRLEVALLKEETRRAS